MMSKHLWVAGLVVATFLMLPGDVRSCFGQAGDETARLTFPEYFPAITGASYTYRLSNRVGERIVYRIDVGAPIRLQGIPDPVIPLRTVFGGKVTGVVYVTSDARGFIRYVDEVPQCAFTYSPPLRLPSDMKPGDRYEHEGGVVARDRNRRDDIDCLASVGRAAVTFTGVETVPVPAGTFPSCVRLLSESVSRDEEGDVTREERVLYYAPTVGLVKEIEDGGESVHELLTYEAPRARIEVTPAALDFGVLSLNRTRSRTVTLKNVGDRGADLRGAIVAPDAPFALTSGGGEFVLRPGQTRRVTIGLKVSATGRWEGGLTIRSNGGEKVVSLVGRS